MSELRVPSSTTCVETSALPSNAQNSAATVPAWRAVKATSVVVPCSRTAPVERSWNSREKKYSSRNIRNSERPGEKVCFKTRQTREVERNAPTAALLRVVMTIRARTTIMLKPQTIMLAILPSDPCWPALRIPHSGLIPTGALAGSEEIPVSVVGEWFSSWR